MDTQTASLDMYENLLDLDQQLHSILSQLEGKKTAVSLQELQEHIQHCLPEEIEDSTELIRKFREKEYEY